MAHQHNHPLPPLSKVICQKYSINQSELEENTRNWQQAQATHKGFFFCDVYQTTGDETRNSPSRTATAGRCSQALHASPTDAERDGAATT